MQVAFYKHGGTSYDALIRSATFSKYSHCEIVFSDQMWFSSSPRDGGVRFKMIDPTPSRWDFLPITFSQEMEVLAWCETQKGMLYDWSGAFTALSPIRINMKNRWFCSEICAKVLQLGGLLKCVNYKGISPGGLYKKMIHK